MCRRERCSRDYVNRLGYSHVPRSRKKDWLQSGVADAATIDRAFRNACGIWASLCGPLRWIDITGGPALYARAMQGVLPTLSKTTEIPACSPRCETAMIVEY